MILKKSNTKWLDVEGFEGVKVKIDYTTPEQDEDLRELMFQLMFNNPNIGKDDNEVKIELTIEQLAKQERLSEKLAKLRIRYQVKDWQGVNDEKGEAVPLVIVNNMIEKSLYDSFIRNFNYSQLLSLGTKIQDETEFNEADKKKLFSDGSEN